MSVCRRVLLEEICDDVGDEACLPLRCLELQFQQAECVQNEGVLFTAQCPPQVIHFFHRRRIQVEDQFEGFQLIERIGGRVGGKRRGRDGILIEHILELEEANGPRQNEQCIGVDAVSRNHQDVEVQEYGWILIDDSQGGIVANLVGNILESLLFADVDHRKSENV